MEIIIIIAAWLGLSVGIGEIAKQRGRDSTSWFVIALITSPVLALLMLIALPQQIAAVSSPEGQRVKCDQCAELILSDAKRCRFCGAPRIPAEMPADTNSSTVNMGGKDAITPGAISIAVVMLILIVFSAL
jgi:hypothetical protein